MVPMALALEKGSQMQAPLGLAVIGGLVMSTFATLLVLPSVFAIVIGKSKSRSPSMYPDDPESAHYDPLVFAHTDEAGHELPPPAAEHAPTHPHHPDNHLIGEWRELSPLPASLDTDEPGQAPREAAPPESDPQVRDDGPAPGTPPASP
jgi:hypothetical protein